METTVVQEIKDKSSKSCDEEEEEDNVDNDVPSTTTFRPRPLKVKKKNIKATTTEPPEVEDFEEHWKENYDDEEDEDREYPEPERITRRPIKIRKLKNTKSTRYNIRQPPKEVIDNEYDEVDELELVGYLIF